ncbi:MAG: hypothetical protein GC181_16045, partial [Bacteroidetes bacterium]|nr:hypothetical protein [Bacteroidota bacterium]
MNIRITILILFCVVRFVPALGQQMVDFDTSTYLSEPFNIVPFTQNEILISASLKSDTSFLSGNSIVKKGKSDAIVFWHSNHQISNWVHFYSEGKTEINSTIIRDSSIFISGKYKKELVFGNEHLFSTGTYGSFLASFDLSLKLRWIKPIGTSDDTAYSEIRSSVAANDDYIITFNTHSAISDTARFTLGNTTSPQVGPTKYQVSIFSIVTVWDKSGKVQWYKIFEGLQGSVDCSDSLVAICYSPPPTAIIDSISYRNPYFAAWQISVSLRIKNGKVKWVVPIYLTDIGSIHLYTIKYSAGSDLFVISGGFYGERIQAGKLSINNTFIYGGLDVFNLGINSLGKLVWYNHPFGGGSDYPVSVSINKQNKMALCGVYETSIYCDQDTLSLGERGKRGFVEIFNPEDGSTELLFGVRTLKSTSFIADCQWLNDSILFLIGQSDLGSVKFSPLDSIVLNKKQLVYWASFNVKKQSLFLHSGEINPNVYRM